MSTLGPLRLADFQPGRQLTLLDFAEPAPELPEDELLERATKDLRERFQEATAKVLRGIDRAETAIGIYRALGRTRERMVALEERLFDVERLLSCLIRSRAESVQLERDIFESLEAVLGESAPELLDFILERVNVRRPGRAFADPAHLTEAMRNEDHGAPEPNGAVAALIHGNDEDAIEDDRELEGLDLEDWG